LELLFIAIKYQTVNHSNTSADTVDHENSWQDSNMLKEASRRSADQIPPGKHLGFNCIRLA
jgi:hypothetical protein